MAKKKNEINFKRKSVERVMATSIVHILIEGGFEIAAPSSSSMRDRAFSQEEQRERERERERERDGHIQSDYTSCLGMWG